MKFRETNQFPYELDKYQKPIRSFTITKIFDSDKRKWKAEADFASDADLSRREQIRKIELDLQIDYTFSVNDVRFNTGLNADFAEALE